jgi:NTE family protein
MLLFVCFFVSLTSVFTFNQLSFSGGGSFGAVEIGILKKLHQMEPKKYDMYTGISAGGLNAGLLSFYDELTIGIEVAEKLYSTMTTHNIYSILPETHVSIFNTGPLHELLTNTLSRMKNKSKIHTLIGATNLYTGTLDVFTFNEKPIDEQVKILLSTSAIPVLFPPISYNGYMYADGGTLSNQLLDIIHVNDYMNITYITPYNEMEEDDTPITSLKEMIERTFLIIKNTFDDELTKMNRNCVVSYGEINHYFVDSAYLQGYNVLNFNNGKELIDIGFEHMEHEKIKLC